MSVITITKREKEGNPIDNLLKEGWVYSGEDKSSWVVVYKGQDVVKVRKVRTYHDYELDIIKAQ